MAKKLWIMNHYAIGPNSGGGTRHYDFAYELVKRGYDVTIFASSFDHKLRKEKLNDGEKYRKEIINGVKFVWIKTVPYQKNDFNRIRNMISFAKNLKKVCKHMEAPDTIIASSVHPLTCIAGYSISKKKNAKYIAEIRDLWPQTLIDMGAISEKSIITKVLRFMEKYIYKKAEKIIVLLPGAVEYIKSVGIEEEKVVYIPNGIVVNRVQKILNKKSVNEKINDIMNEHKNKFNAVYLGAHGKANELDVIIDAAKILKNNNVNDVDLLFVGDGPEKNNLIKKCKENNLTNVYFYDPISKYEVPLLLDKIDLCMVSMGDYGIYKYGISLNKLFDYLCSRKPIVFSGNVMNDIVKEANAGISVNARDSEGLANAILKIRNMSVEERNKLGQNGFEYVKKYHDISSILVDKLERII